MGVEVPYQPQRKRREPEPEELEPAEAPSGKPVASPSDTDGNGTSSSDTNPQAPPHPENVRVLRTKHSQVVKYSQAAQGKQKVAMEKLQPQLIEDSQQGMYPLTPCIATIEPRMKINEIAMKVFMELMYTGYTKEAHEYMALIKKASRREYIEGIIGMYCSIRVDGQVLQFKPLPVMLQEELARKKREETELMRMLMASPEEQEPQADGFQEPQ